MADNEFIRAWLEGWTVDDLARIRPQETDWVMPMARESGSQKTLKP